MGVTLENNFQPCLIFVGKVEPTQVEQLRAQLGPVLLDFVHQQFTNVDKLECFFLVNFPNLVSCLWVSLEAHSRVAHRPYLQTWTRFEKLARYKRSILLRTFVNYCCKKFYNIGSLDIALKYCQLCVRSVHIGDFRCVLYCVLPQYSILPQASFYAFSA